MATLREIKRRIESVKSTQQITKAMKMVAAAKLRKSQQQLLDLRPYAKKLFNITSTLAQLPSARHHIYFENRKPDKVLYVLVTADRGLCGSFNSNLIKAAAEAFDGQASAKIVAIGRKGYDHFRRRRYRIAAKYIDFFNKVSFRDAEKIVSYLTAAYEQKKVDRVYIIYNEFQSIIQQNIVIKQFLPIVPELSSEDGEERRDLFEPAAQKILKTLTPRALLYSMNLILLESFCAEQGARMTAMETASDNANDMIKALVLFYNKARQAAITKELNEIVGGAEALKG